MEENVSLLVLVIQASLFGSQLTIFLFRPLEKSNLKTLALITIVILQQLVLTFTYFGNSQIGTSLISIILSSFTTVFFLDKFGLQVLSKRFKIALALPPVILATLLIHTFFTDGDYMLYLCFLPLFSLITWAILVTEKILGKDKVRPVQRYYIIISGILIVTPVFPLLSNLKGTYLLVCNLCLLAIYGLNLNQYIRDIRQGNRKTVNSETFNYDIEELRVLSEMEYKVAVMLIKGLTFDEIGDKFNITSSVCRWHGTNIYRKLNCEGNLREFRKRYGHLKHSHSLITDFGIA